MLKVILVLVILVLIVVLRQRISENFNSLSKIMVDTGLDSATISENAKYISSNEVPLVTSYPGNDEVRSFSFKKSIVYNDGPRHVSGEITEEQADDPEFYIKIMDQITRFLQKLQIKELLVDNLMNELRKLAKNSTPTSVLARKYRFNNIGENPDKLYN